MGRASDIFGPTALHAPLVEGVFIPISATVASAGVAAVLMRIVMVVTGLTTSWVAYVVILLAAVIGASATTVRGILNLSGTLRALDFSAMLLFTVIVMYLLPFAPGHLRVAGNDIPVNLLTSGVCASFMSWFFATSLCWVVSRVFPLTYKRPIDPTLDDRLVEETELRSVYSGGEHALQARFEAVRGVNGLLLNFILIYLLFSSLWAPAGSMRTDTLLAIWSGITVAGILAYLAFVNLANNRRMWERQHTLVLPRYSYAWGLGVIIPIALACVVGGVFPANISPLANLDYNDIMDRLTKFLVRVFFARKRNFVSGSSGLVGDTAVGGGSVTAIMGGSGGMGPVPIIVLLGIPAMIFVIYRALKSVSPFASMAIDAEKERNRGLLAILRALLLWPFRMLAALFVVAKSHSSKETANSVGLAKKIWSTMKARRTLVHPDDPALFVRHVYGRLLRTAAQAGIARRQDETAIEYARSLSKLLPDAETSVHELTQVYCDVRYTGEVPPTGIRGKALTLLRTFTRHVRFNRKGRETQREGVGQ